VRQRVAEISVPAESRYVAIARNFVIAVAREAGWLSGEQLDDLRLVASETVTNAVRAQRSVAATDQIRVRCAATPQQFEFSVADSAGGFDVPETATLAAGDLGREGGFGLPIISELSDEAHFDIDEGGTVVRALVFRRGEGW